MEEESNGAIGKLISGEESNKRFKTNKIKII